LCPGRNAIYLAQQGFTVDALDSSQEAIGWAREKANEKGGKGEFFAGKYVSAGVGG